MQRSRALHRVNQLAKMVLPGESPKRACTISAVSSVPLEGGGAMPAVGLGLWKISRESCANTVYEAVKAGYRCFDGASDYGNEKECGDGLKRALSEGLVRREDVWVTSKLWNTYHRKEHVELACRRSLTDWGLEYFDLFMIHFPISLKFVPFETRYPPEWFHDPTAAKPKMVEDPVPLRETWEAMEELVGKGLVRNVGMCNVGTSMLRDMLSYAKIKPAVLQVELHPYNSQQKLVRFCRERGIAVTGFSNLGASSYLEMGGTTEADFVINEPSVKEIARAHGRTAAQVVLRWAVQRGTTVVPKSTNPKRLRENLDVFGFELTEKEMAAIDGLNKDRRFNDPGVFCEDAFNTFFPIYE